MSFSLLMQHFLLPSPGPYTAGLTGSYAYSTLSYPTQHPSAAIGLQAAQRVQNGPTNVYASDTSSLYQTSISSGSTMNGLYGTTQQRMSQPLIGMPAFNWPTMPAATPLSLTTTSTGNLQQSRPSSNTGPLHSPLTAYSADTLRTHSGQSTLDVAADGSTYSLQQPSPAEQMLPECASTEPSKSLAILSSNQWAFCACFWIELFFLVERRGVMTQCSC